MLINTRDMEVILRVVFVTMSEALTIPLKSRATEPRRENVAGDTIRD